MKIVLHWVGKTKDVFIRDGIRKYLGFLRPYASVDVIEIKEEKGSFPTQAVKEREGRRILRQVNDFILLDEGGHQYTSRGFAELLKSFEGSVLKFVIGGSFGVSEAVHREAKIILSLSNLTFTHEMSRLILLEQLYRAFTILHNKKYHY